MPIPLACGDGGTCRRTMAPQSQWIPFLIQKAGGWERTRPKGQTGQRFPPCPLQRLSIRNVAPLCRLLPALRAAGEETSLGQKLKTVFPPNGKFASDNRNVAKILLRNVLGLINKHTVKHTVKQNKQTYSRCVDRNIP